MIAIPASWSSPGLAALWLFFYILLAAIVTIDVLLKKSDVRGALGWIAAAWLSPILGALIYYLFGINRVTRRAARFGKRNAAQGLPPLPAIRPDASDNIALLLECGARISQHRLTAGNGVFILEGGDAAYPAMLEAIEKAQHCIALTSYIFRDDKSGGAFADALLRAQLRGVKVRVLLDSIGAGYFHAPMFHRLKQSNVPVARFLHTWLPWRMPFLNMRNHCKLLVADGAQAFMGGMNIGDENCRSLKPAGHIADIHFRVLGPAARMAMDAFARDWYFTTGERLDDDCWWPQASQGGAVFARGLHSGPDADIYKLEMILGAALTLARAHIRIVTPYFLPDARLQFAIAQACLRGVRVDLVLPERSNHVLTDWAMRGHLRFFRHIPMNVYLSPQPFDHSKLVTVDGQWSLIGSSNWDARSFRLNFEYDLECHDRELAAGLDALVDARIGRARKLSYDTLIAQPVVLRLRDAAARLLIPYL